MVCFTQLYVCVRGWDQQCWVAVPGGREGGSEGGWGVGGVNGYKA